MPGGSGGAQSERHRAAENTLDAWVNGNRELWKKKGMYLLLQHPNEGPSCWSGCSVLVGDVFLLTRKSIRKVVAGALSSQ